MGVQRQFDEEFKRGAVELAGRVGVYAAARDLEMSVAALHRWCRDDLSSVLKKENRKLRKELRDLKRVAHVLKEFLHDHKSH